MTKVPDELAQSAQNLIKKAESQGVSSYILFETEKQRIGAGLIKVMEKHDAAERAEQN